MIVEKDFRSSFDPIFNLSFVGLQSDRNIVRGNEGGTFGQGREGRRRLQRESHSACSSCSREKAHGPLGRIIRK